MHLTLKKVILLFICFSATESLQAQEKINEEKFISIGGIDQWVTISGNDLSKPVILFIHGGPGSVLSPYSDAIYGDWKDDFILVNWDQRGAGRTFGKDAPEVDLEDYWLSHPLTLDQMVEDGIELTRYVLKRLEKQKVILLGSSWGTILGTKMVLKNPELFHAYIGHAQFVSYEKNLTSAYSTTLELALKSNDTLSIQKLKTLGSPPYTDARSLGQLLRIVKEYEKKYAAPLPSERMIISPVYDNEEDSQARYNGDDYSFLYFAGYEKLGIESMARDVDFLSTNLKYDIPVFLIQGKHDILTSMEISKEFFDRLTAPKKEYIILNDAAHGYTESVINKQYEILKHLGL